MRTSGKPQNWVGQGRTRSTREREKHRARSNRKWFLSQNGCGSSTCQVVLHLLLLGPLLPMWVSLILSDASACRTATCSSALFPGSIGTSPAPHSTRALTRSVSPILSLYAFILAFPIKVLSMIILILSSFIVMFENSRGYASSIHRSETFAMNTDTHASRSTVKNDKRDSDTMQHGELRSCRGSRLFNEFFLQFLILQPQ